MESAEPVESAARRIKGSFILNYITVGVLSASVTKIDQLLFGKTGRFDYLRSQYECSVSQMSREQYMRDCERRGRR